MIERRKNHDRKAEKQRIPDLQDGFRNGRMTSTARRQNDDNGGKHRRETSTALSVLRTRVNAFQV